MFSATDSDARELVEHLRTQDLAEVLALGSEPAVALVHGLRTAREAWTARDERGRIVCMGGVSPFSLVGTTGIPWLLGSDLVSCHRRAFMIQTRRTVARWLTMFDVLRNVVDARYATSIRWLHWLGFETGPAFALAHGTFCRVWKEAP